MQVFPVLRFTCEGLYFRMKQITFRLNTFFSNGKQWGLESLKEEGPRETVIVLQFTLQYIPVFHRSLRDVGTPA